MTDVQLPLIKEHACVAREKLKEYRALMKEQRTKADLTTIATLRALARGQNLIELGAAMTAGGVHGNGLPRMAIANAAWSRVCFQFGHGRTGWAGKFQQEANVSPHHTGRYISVPSQCLGYAHDRKPRGDALVPTVPPPHRPPDSLYNYAILWEAEWDVSEAPGDPFLLEHVADTFYAVLAQWDLTPLEQSVLVAARRR